MISRVGRGKKIAEEDEDDDDDDDEEEEEEEEESEEEESEEEAAAAATSSKPAAAKSVEATRAERRQLKKQKGGAKQKGKKQGGDDEDDDEEEEDEDPILANPNLNVGKRMNLSDLSAPRELTRRERYVEILCARLVLYGIYCGLVREEKEKKDAQERYWKVSLHFLSLSRRHVLNRSFFSASRCWQDRPSQSRPRQARKDQEGA